MSASKFSDAEVSMLWGVSLQSGHLGRVDEAALSRILGIPIRRVRAVVSDLIEIGFFEPMTRRMDFSRLPPQKWRAFSSSEEFEAHLRALLGDVF